MDSITISNLILDKFKYYGAFDKYKEILYNRKVDLTYLRFSNIKPEFKKEFFDKLQEDYNLVVSEGLYEDYLNVLNQRNKLIFRTCLIAKDYEEFILRISNFDNLNSLNNLKKEIKKMENEVLVLKQENSKGKVIAISCGTARYLGKELVQNGNCTVYLGFNTKIHFNKKNSKDYISPYYSQSQ